MPQQIHASYVKRGRTPFKNITSKPCQKKMTSWTTTMPMLMSMFMPMPTNADVIANVNVDVDAHADVNVKGSKHAYKMQ